MATISLRKLAKRIGAHNQLIKGLAIGLGIQPQRTAIEFLFTEAQALRIEQHYRKHQASEPIPSR